jgi:hypothetical protein
MATEPVSMVTLRERFLETVEEGFKVSSYFFHSAVTESMVSLAMDSFPNIRFT